MKNKEMMREEFEKAKAEFQENHVWFMRMGAEKPDLKIAEWFWQAAWELQDKMLDGMVEKMARAMEKEDAHHGYEALNYEAFLPLAASAIAAIKEGV